MGQYRTDLFQGKPSATASSNSPVCCKGTSHTMPVRIAGGDPHAFLHVNLHLNRCLVSLSLIPNVHFQGSPKHCYLPALPVRPVFIQDCHHQLSLCSSPLHEPSCCFIAPGAHTWGAQHCKAGIPTGAELKNYYIPCSLLLGKMYVKGYAFLVH